jgi:hypothetical protein
MKQLLATDTPGSYAFDKTAKTVTFSGLRQSITLSNILLITNVTANTIIYNFVKRVDRDLYDAQDVLE